MKNGTEIIVASIIGGISMRMNGSDIEQDSCFVFALCDLIESIIGIFRIENNLVIY